MSENLLYEEIYQKTQDCGRTQFVKLLQQSQIKIEQLQQENKELKKYCCKRNDCSGRLKENNKLTDNEVLTEFEKWLEYQIRQCEKETNPKQFSEHDIEITTNTMCRFQQCLNKLQELKEGKK